MKIQTSDHKSNGHYIPAAIIQQILPLFTNLELQTLHGNTMRTDLVSKGRLYEVFTVAK